MDQMEASVDEPDIDGVDGMHTHGGAAVMGSVCVSGRAGRRRATGDEQLWERRRSYGRGPEGAGEGSGRLAHVCGGCRESERMIVVGVGGPGGEGSLAGLGNG